MNKDDQILYLLERLRRTLGANAFQVVDHWPADRTAIGIASLENQQVLAYLRPNGERYDIELELPPDASDEYPHQPAGSFEQVSFEELLEIVADHLGVNDANTQGHTDPPK